MVKELAVIITDADGVDAEFFWFAFRPEAGERPLAFLKRMLWREGMDEGWRIWDDERMDVDLHDVGCAVRNADPAHGALLGYYAD